MADSEPGTVVILIPVWNDWETVALLLPSLDSALAGQSSSFQILLVDDGSSDDTTRAVSDLLHQINRVRYLRLTRTFGREVAIAAGLETTIGDFVVVLIPKTDPVALIPELVEKCRRGSGVVCGVSTSPRHFLAGVTTQQSRVNSPPPGVIFSAWQFPAAYR